MDSICANVTPYGNNGNQRNDSAFQLSYHRKRRNEMEENVEEDFSNGIQPIHPTVSFSNLSYEISNQKLNDSFVTDGAIVTTKPSEDNEWQWNDNTTKMIIQALEEHYNPFHYSTEVYLMTCLAGIGIVFNILCLLALYFDRQTSSTARKLHSIYLLTVEIYLIFMISFLQMKQSITSHSLEAFNYLTTFLGFCQFLQPWMLFNMAAYAREHLEILCGLNRPKIGHLSQIISFPIIFLLLILIFAASYFSLYLPPLRIHFYTLLDNYSLCSVPMEDHWNPKTHDDEVMDVSGYLFYKLVYGLIYFLIVYFIPFIAIAHRSKGIVDLLQVLQDDPRILKNNEALASVSLVFSVTCNLHLTSISIKTVVLLLYSIQSFSNSFIGESHIFFRYLNVLGNLAMIIGCGGNVFVLIRCNLFVKFIVLNLVLRFKSYFHSLLQFIPRFNRRDIGQSFSRLQLVDVRTKPPNEASIAPD